VLANPAEMGFQVYTSREVESDEMNFSAELLLRITPRAKWQDSFYIEVERREDNPILMRTHTFAGKIRAMREAAASTHDPPPSALRCWDVLPL